MPQASKKNRQPSANEMIRRRIADWQDQDPSSLLTKKVEKATAPLQWLVALMLPDRLVQEVLGTTLRAAELLTDRGDVLKSFNLGKIDEVFGVKIDQCDATCEQVQFWSVGAAAALGAWDVAGPLAVVPSLTSLLTLAFRTVKKLGLTFGYDTATPAEEMIALHIFVAGCTLYHRDKVQAFKAIKKIEADVAANPSAYTRDDVDQLIQEVTKAVGEHLTRRRTLASIPAVGAIAGTSTNAWLLQDIAWAARNVYAARRFQKRQDARVVALEKRAANRETDATAVETETPVARVPLPKAA